MQALNTTFPCRDKQLRVLHDLFGHPQEPLPECVYVYGGQSTGKSDVTKSLMETVDRRHAMVDLVGCYTARLLFEGVLNKLTGHKIDPRKGQPYERCDNLMDFIFHLRNYAKLEDLDGAVIILDKAERLRQMEWNLLPGFMRLREVSGVPLSVVLISELAFEKFFARTDIVEPLKVHFPQYNKDQFLKILLLDYEHSKELVLAHHNETFEYDEGFYENYLNVFLSVFYRACRDLIELRYMSRVNFVRYCAPIIKGECKPTDSMHLWRNAASILKASLDVLYLRTANEGPNQAQSLELPFYAKYLLIAAYLASYNPAKEDKRLFMKYHGKKKKTIRDVKAKSKVSETLATQLGPKAFSLDRLLAIFYAILDDKVGFNNNLLVQVSSLVELHLLLSLSDGFSLDGQKYKCNVNYDFIQTISKMVSFNIRKYLVDFSHM